MKKFDKNFFRPHSRLCPVLAGKLELSHDKIQNMTSSFNISRKKCWLELKSDQETMGYAEILSNLGATSELDFTTHGGLNVLASRLFPLIADPQKLMPVLHLVTELTGRGPRSEGSSEDLLLICTGILSLGSSCSEKNKKGVFQSERKSSHKRWWWVTAWKLTCFVTHIRKKSTK